jgi:hypothetical protein
MDGPLAVLLRGKDVSPEAVLVKREQQRGRT